MSDYTEHDRLRRQAVETASDQLLASLWRAHPHIMAHLRAKQIDNSNRST